MDVWEEEERATTKLVSSSKITERGLRDSWVARRVRMRSVRERSAVFPVFPVFPVLITFVRIV